MALVAGLCGIAAVEGAPSAEAAATPADWVQVARLPAHDLDRLPEREQGRPWPVLATPAAGRDGSLIFDLGNGVIRVLKPGSSALGPVVQACDDDASAMTAALDGTVFVVCARFVDTQNRYSVTVIAPDRTLRTVELPDALREVGAAHTGADGSVYVHGRRRQLDEDGWHGTTYVDIWRLLPGADRPERVMTRPTASSYEDFWGVDGLGRTYAGRDVDLSRYDPSPADWVAGTYLGAFHPPDWREPEGHDDGQVSRLRGRDQGPWRAPDYVQVADDGAVALVRDADVDRILPDGTTQKLVAGEASSRIFGLRMAPNGRLAVLTGTPTKILDSGQGDTWWAEADFRLRVFGARATTPEKDVPWGTGLKHAEFPDGLAITPAGIVRVHRHGMVETLTGQTSAAAPQPPTLVAYWGDPPDLPPWEEERLVADRLVWEVVPGDHPAVPTTYTVQQTRHDPPFDPRGERETTAEAPVFTGRATARTADGRTVTGAAVPVSATKQVEEPFTSSMSFALGVYGSSPLWTGAAQEARLNRGHLPAGLSMDSRGLIYGTPTGSPGQSEYFTVNFRRPEGVHRHGQFRLDRSPTKWLQVHASPVRLTWEGDWAVGLMGPTSRVDVDAQIVTGIASFVNDPEYRVEKNPWPRRQTRYAYPFYDRVRVDGTEPVVVRFSSPAASNVLYRVIRPEGAPTRGADLWARLDAPADVTPGEVVRLGLTWGNTGPEKSGASVAAVTVPSGVSIVGTTCRGAQVAVGKLVAAVDPLASEQVQSCTLTVKAPNATPGTTATIVAGLTSATHDPITANNVARITVGIRAR